MHQVVSYPRVTNRLGVDLKSRWEQAVGSLGPTLTYRHLDLIMGLQDLKDVVCDDSCPALSLNTSDSQANG